MHFEATCFRVHPAGAVRTCLDAIRAADAILLVHQHHAIIRLEGCTDRADLHARRLRAVVAELGNEEGPFDLSFARGGRESIDPPVRAVDHDLPVCLDHVSLDPGIEEERLLGNIVFDLAGRGAATAADALADVDSHAVEAPRRLLVGLACQLPCQDGKAEDAQEDGACQATDVGEERAPVDRSLVLPGSIRRSGPGGRHHRYAASG